MTAIAGRSKFREFSITSNVPIAYVVSVATKLFGLGCTELSLGDTIGVATPGRVVALIDALVAARIPLERIAGHFHDTYGQGLANTLTVLQRGVTTVDASSEVSVAVRTRKAPRANSPPKTPVAARRPRHPLRRPLGKLAEVNAWLAKEMVRPSPSRGPRTDRHSNRRL
jgi:hydroxymethylglutaryl-CoA lyase